MQSMLTLPVSSSNHLEYTLMDVNIKEVKLNPEPLITEGQKIANDVFENIFSKLEGCSTYTFYNPLKLRISIACLRMIHPMKDRIRNKKKFRNAEKIITVIARSALERLNHLFRNSMHSDFLINPQRSISSHLNWCRIVDEKTGKFSKSFPDTITIMAWKGDDVPSASGGEGINNYRVKNIFDRVMTFLPTMTIVPGDIIKK